MLRRALFKLPLRSQPVKLNTPYYEKLTRHRNLMPLYDLWPEYQNGFIAPSATVVGEVELEANVTIWYNAVLRGDINKIFIKSGSVIGENVVILTASSLPTGIKAEAFVGNNSYIGPRSTLYSCTVLDYVHIGAGSVICDGARLESGCVILPGSVVPPGRLIPAKQIWGGNPVKFVKNLYENDEMAVKEEIEHEYNSAMLHNEQFGEIGHAYMYEE
mmetsp:Transcript_2698/g.323  ORF Transcript_2698/g.323 Transcript_2698/m.323 type:complete len:216 (-) Transcript_2698:25-672(-)|eukprot:CAMPEP_0168316108 /NCGR_PEP_ID=MMETSP0210-20121227/14324_1 /TAXON_ID=40633 /ORGANISM="Condylostoma magnum, Strain COL2" /LENGTH=215 /DNA_ID=CAMNT_0008294761 /DNA_START=24 /DNA_END=671 /DNA_ORIENTATION=-